MPRPKLNPTDQDRRMVKALAGMGIPQKEIARKIGVRSPKTLRKHFRDELDEGATDANCNVAKALYQNAKDGNVAAQIFWLKSRAGWREGKALEATSTPPPPFIVALDSEVPKP